MQLDFCPRCFTITDGNFCHKCGYNISAYETQDDVLAPGTFIYTQDKNGEVHDKYKIGCMLGRGGFGITYSCQETKTGKRFAAKEYMPQSIAHRLSGGMVEPLTSADEKAYADGLNLFLAEASRLVDFAGHDNIVNLKSFVAANNTGYIIMEYLDGINMKQKLQKVNTIDSDSALRVLYEVADCLRVVHSRGVIHGDISPENIMELNDANHTIKLIDFGAAKSYVRQQQGEYVIFLKHGYAPPEQYSNDARLGSWTDIYALAATYYKLVTGVTPPRAIDRKGKDTLLRLDKNFEGISKAVADAIEKAMSVDFKNRYMSMDEFVADLKRASSIPPRIKHNNIEINSNNTISQVGESGKRSPLRLFTPAEKRRQERLDKINERKEKREQRRNGTPAKDSDDRKPIVNKVYAGMNPFVRISRNGNQIGIWNIRPGDEVAVGRDSSQCGVVVQDEMISRCHCTIMYDAVNNVFIFVDKSKNGVYTDRGTRLESKITYKFKSGTVLRLATDVLMELGGNYEQ